MEPRTKYVALSIIVLITLGAALLFSRSSKAKTEVKPIYWGGTFGGKTPLSNNVKYDCSHNGQKTCCALLDDEITSQPSRSLQNSTTSRSLLKGTKSLKALKPFDMLHEKHHDKQHDKQHDKHEMCTTKKLYIPSPYESAHFAKAEELHGIKDEKNRTRALIAYIQEEIPASIAWLARVKEHMSSEAVPHATEDDLQYLSRFQITRTCKGQSKTWVEWIEPLTVHARHPFGFDQCSDISVYTREQMLHFGFVDMVSLDYMIVQSGQSLHEATSVTSHNHTKPLRVGNKAGHKGEHVTSSFLFDAGTSTFDSSLVWFLCAYLQRKIAFDQNYGYEYTLLEPQDFWKRVPPRVIPTYHFFNAPVPANTTDPLSPLKIIRDIATVDDFVSFKLDIDTPSVEIPLAMELLRNAQVSKLVDEFFFELHFRCEIMKRCGWRDKMPEEYMGLKLDRLHAMRYFQELRKLGIRAHIWP